MNPEIYAILEDMKSKGPKPEHFYDARVLQNYLSIKMARLLVLLAEESEKQSNKLSEQTGKLIVFTNTLRYLTWALLGLGVVQSVYLVVQTLKYFGVL